MVFKSFNLAYFIFKFYLSLVVKFGWKIYEFFKLRRVTVFLGFYFLNLFGFFIGEMMRLSLRGVIGNFYRFVFE